MSNCFALLLLSFALFVSCDKTADTYVADADDGMSVYDEILSAMNADDSSVLFTDPVLRERYFTIEDSIGFYVGKLEEIEKLYYTQNVSNDELVQLSVAGLELQEELRSYIKSIINDNIENVLGIYLLAVYNELYSTEELLSLVKHIHITTVHENDSPLYNIIVNIAEERQTQK